MSILVLKTNLETPQEVHKIEPILNAHPSITDWNVDVQDIDNILRIVAEQEITENQIIALLNQHEVQSEILTY